MVRKTKQEASETVTILLDAAEREFRQNGVARTTLANVATAAGMTRGAIYWHFKDKNALFQAMCDRAFLPMQSLLNEIMAASDKDPLDALRQLSVHMLTQVAKNPRQRTVFTIMFHHCEKNDEMAFLANEMEKRGECLSKVEKILQEAVRHGQLPSDTDTSVSVHAMHSYLIGLLHEWLIEPTAYDLERHAEVMIKIFLAGLVANPPRKN